MIGGGIGGVMVELQMALEEPFPWALVTALEGPSPGPWWRPLRPWWRALPGSGGALGSGGDRTLGPGGIYLYMYMQVEGREMDYGFVNRSPVCVDFYPWALRPEMT